MTHQLPLGFEQWGPVPQAFTLGLATFVQEDLPTISAAILSGAHQLGLWTGFLGCFFGIWIGDLLLYAAARYFGRPLLEASWVKRWISAESVGRSERWFSARGTWLLASSRFIPGTRLPTYLAAGFLKVPLIRFASVTGLVVAIWTTLLFVLARQFGSQLTALAQRWSHWGLVLSLGILGLFALLHGINRLLRWGVVRKTRAAWGRAMRWEFWPASIFYLPIVFNYLRLSIRHRSLLAPAASNPGILTGGLVSESKVEILKNLLDTSPEYTADAYLIAPADSATRVARFHELLAIAGLTFPVILKPDVGQRGAGVKLIRTAADAESYLSRTAAPMILQRYIAGPFEVGIFYYRLPTEDRGRIFAITEKIFPVLIGDGEHTVEELIWNDPRARFVAARYLERFSSRRTEVLAQGQTLRLVEAGNHAQGCIFQDGARFLTPELEAKIDRISQKVNGFFIGRYDIRFASEEDLCAGRNFSIIELNGASAEATNVYDARNSLLSAYRTLFRQWELVFAIGAANLKAGIKSMPAREFLSRWREARLAISTYPLAD